jgi:Glycosyl transferase family 2
MIELLAPADWRKQVFADTKTLRVYPGITEYLAAASRAARELEPITCRGPLPREAVAVVGVIRNEMRRLPGFLSHYRELGADRFLMVDNASDDGGSTFLANQPDVDLWLARGSYSAASYGCLWTDGLAHAIARGHWVLVADADELLVYDGMQRHNLHDLAQLLDRRGERRLNAPLIDLYGRDPIRTTSLPESEPLSAQWWFDTTSYQMMRSPYGDMLLGGPRARVFSTPGRPFTVNAQKFPFSRFDAATGYCWIHRPYPYHWNRGRPMAALLHLKFTEEFPALVERAGIEKQHAGDEYCVYQNALRDRPDVSFFGPDSRLYEGPQSLIAAGLINIVDWSDSRRYPRWDVSNLRHRLHALAQASIGPDFRQVRQRWLDGSAATSTA